MEHNPVCVIKVEVNCCTTCQKKLRKMLLRISGVLEVSYDPKTKLATIRGKFDPLMLIEAIKEKGKNAELISYSKNPLYSRNSNHHDFDKTDQKGKSKVGDKKINEHCSDSDDHIHEYVSTKNKKKYHKAEAYVAPKGVDESICRDRFCNIHRRGGGILDRVTQEERQKNYAMFLQMGAAQYPPYPPMSGLNDFTPYFHHQHSRTCTIM